MLVSDKSTGQTVVNGVWSNVTYSFVSMVAGYDLYIIIKNDKSRGFPIDYINIRGMQVQGVIFPWTNVYYTEKSGIPVLKPRNFQIFYFSRSFEGQGVIIGI